MDEIERRLRAAMIRATEPAPSGLLANIYQRHQRHRVRRRRAMVGCVAFAAAVALAVPPIGHALRHSSFSNVPHSAGSARPSKSRANQGNHVRPKAAPGTMLLTCDDANWGQLQSNWQALSLKAGPIWFFAARQGRGGFVHFSNFRLPGRSLHRYRGLRGDFMIIEVADGATAVMKPAAAARSYFRFYDGFNGPSPYRLPAGDTGFTFAACPRPDTGPNGPVTDFYLGYAIKANRTARVDIWDRPSQRPIQVIFTCPGC
jgi:hypothetical protein